MKCKIRFHLFIISIVILTACSTPDQLRTGAEFSAIQLALLETELYKHAKSANEAVKERRLRILKGHKADFDLKAEVENQLYITKGSNKHFSNLIMIIKRYEERNNNLEVFLHSEKIRLKGLTAPLNISSKSFSKAQQALTDLADEESKNEQFDFFLKYILDVQSNIGTQ